MFIDGHAHFLGVYSDVNKITATLQSNNLDRVILMPADSKKEYSVVSLPLREPILFLNHFVRLLSAIAGSSARINQGNQAIFQSKAQLPDKIIQFYWLTQDYLTQLDDDYAKMNFQGLKVHQCWKYFDIDSAFFSNVLNWLEEKQIPLFIHFYSLRDIEKFIKKMNSYTFPVIIAHLMAYELFLEVLKEKKGENYYFDISNCYWNNKTRVKKAYQELGAKKLIFGSDAPYGKESVENTLKIVEQLDLSSEERDLILGGNIAKLLEL